MGAVINGMEVLRTEGQRVVLQPIAREMSIVIPEMIRVAGGTFSMGSTKFADAQPIRQVTLRDFAIGKYPVTNGEYLGFLQVMGRSIPDLVADPEFIMHPVVNISWHAATEYCAFLREITKTDDGKFRNFGLPTEAQWEFAARGAKGREYPWGNESYEGRVTFNSRGTTPVDTFPFGATPSGIWGMSGNVWEWCVDWFGKYTGDNLKDPKGPENGTYRVLRGGSWYNLSADFLLATYRDRHKPWYQDINIGLRLAEDLSVTP